MLIDILFLALMVYAVYKGLTRGFIVGLFSFFAYFIGLAAALKLSPIGAQFMAGKDTRPSFWMAVVSFLIIFILVVLIVNLIARFIRSIVKVATLGWADKIAGIILFAIIYTFIFSILLFYASEGGWVTDPVKENSRIYASVLKVGPVMTDVLGKLIPYFKDLFGELKTFFENLKVKV